MRYICMLLGWLTGRWNVRCVECANLDAEGRCYGHKMPPEILDKTISCGFYRRKAAS